MRKTPAAKSWKMHLFEGFLLVGCAGFLFWYFTDFENSNDTSRRINWLFALIYQFGGKWLVTAVVLAVAAFDFSAAWKKRSQG